MAGQAGLRGFTELLHVFEDLNKLEESVSEDLAKVEDSISEDLTKTEDSLGAEREQMLGLLGQLGALLLGPGGGRGDPPLLGLLLLVVLWLACLVLLLTCLLCCRCSWRRRRSLARQTSGATTVTTTSSREGERGPAREPRLSSGSWESWSITSSSEHGFLQEAVNSGRGGWRREGGTGQASLV